MKNSNILYVALGGLMLILLQSMIVQDSILNVCDFLGLGGGFINFILCGVTTILSFAGVIVFIIAAIQLIMTNLRKEQ